MDTPQWQKDVLLVRTLIADPITSDIIIIDALPAIPQVNTGYTYSADLPEYDGQIYYYDSSWKKYTLVNGDERIKELISRIGIYRAAKVLLLQQLSNIDTSSSSSTGGLASATIGGLSVSFDSSTAITTEQRIALWKEKLLALDEIIALMGGDSLFGGFYHWCRRPVGGILEYDIA